MKFLGDIDTSNLILLDVKYSKIKNEQGHFEDYAMVLLKNIKTGEKKVFNIKEPEMEIFFVKPEFRNFDYNLSAIERDKTSPKKVKFRNVINEIAKEAGGEWDKYRKECIEQGQYRAMKNLQHYNYVFGSDLELPDYYRCMWNINYHNPDLKVHLTKSFLDIEVDGIESKGVPVDGTCPINAVSLTDGESKTCYSFLLRNAVRDNPLIAEFEANIDDFYKLCHETFDEEFPGFKYQVFMFDDEVTLIKALFSLIRKLDRDFCSIWNMGYDIPYIIKRCIELDIDYVDLMTDPDFAVRDVYYWADHKTGVVVEKKDFLNMSSRTIFTDAMLNYGKIRKGRGVLRSIKLNAIAKLELGSTKMDYHEEANIKTLPYVNYIMFVLYNMKDTLLLYGIESKTEDIDNLFSRATANGSMYRSVFSQTKFLKNRYYIECYKDGFISGNNANMDYASSYDDKEDDDVKFDGAVVGDPELNSHVGVSIFGKRSKYVFKYVVDMDFSSMYPWSIISFNISPHTMIGKLLVEKESFKGEIKDGDTDDPNLKFEPGKEFVENMLANDMVKTGENWFGLPSLEKIISGIDKKYPEPTKVVIPDDGYNILDEPIDVKIEE
jgi:DNA polymerase elongation subunit (family B)